MENGKIKMWHKECFELEGHCTLLFESTNEEVIFYCDGFDTRFVLSILPDIDEINVSELFLERGESKTYKCFDKSDFRLITTFKQLTNLFDTLSDDIYVFRLEVINDSYKIHTYDNRYITIHFKTFLGTDFIKSIILDAIEKAFTFSSIISQDILKVMIASNNKYVVINNKGEVVSIKASNS